MKASRERRLLSRTNAHDLAAFRQFFRTI